MIALILVLGAVVGSFLNLLIHRVPRREDICFKRSYCPCCTHALGPLQLIPVVSFCAQKGRCVWCQNPISKRYVWVELATSVLFGFCWLNFGASLMTLKLVMFFSAMIALFAIDLKESLLPDAFTLPLIISGLGLGLWEYRFFDSLEGMLVGYVSYYSVGFLAKLYYKKDAIGGGDLKLGAAIGAFWGFHIAVESVYLSFVVGGLAGVLLLVFKLKKKTDAVPFGPAMIMACGISVMWGEPIWNYFF